MKKIKLLIFLIVFGVLFVCALPSKASNSKSYNEFFELMKKCHSEYQDHDMPVKKSKINYSRELKLKTLQTFHDMIENEPENPWTFALFIKYSTSIFILDIRTDDFNVLLNFTKDFKYKNEYSKYIFYRMCSHGIGCPEYLYSITFLKKLYVKCNDNKYKPYLNHMLRVNSYNVSKGTYDISKQELELLCDEMLKNYKDHLVYAEAYIFKTLSRTEITSVEEGLKMLLNAISENFYKDRNWKEAYFAPNGLFERAFSLIILKYITLCDYDKASAYFSIMRQKFPQNEDLDSIEHDIEKLKHKSLK